MRSRIALAPVACTCGASGARAKVQRRNVEVFATAGVVVGATAVAREAR